LVNAFTRRAFTVSAALLLAAFNAPAAEDSVQSSVATALQAVRDYRDDQFIGGLDAAARSIAQNLAAQLKGAVPGDDLECEEEPATQGVVIVGPKQAERASLDPSLRAVVDAIQTASPSQRAILLLALREVGPKAAAAASGIGSLDIERDPWAVHALERIECTQYSGGELTHLTPRPVMATGDGRTEAERWIDWLLHNTLDPERTWPPSLIHGTFGRIAQKPTVSEFSLSIDQVNRLLKALDSPAVDPGFKAAWLHVLAHSVVVATELVPSLVALAKSSHSDLAWAAQRALVASGTREGAMQFSQWLVDDVFHWSWGDAGRRVNAFPTVVLPALETALQSAIWSNRAAAVEILGEVGGERAAKLVESAISPLDWPTAQAAAGALGALSVHDPSARVALQELASTYWSGRVRAVARHSARTGKPFVGDPFACDTSIETLPDDAPDGSPDCISFCYGCAIEHQLPACEVGGPPNGRYLLPDQSSIRVRWSRPRRERIPRITAAQVSSWCEERGTTTKLRIADGWLVGCDGFEREGALVFVPRRGPPSVTLVAHLGVTVLAEVDDRIYVAGSQPFEFGDAGALLEISRDASGRWIHKAVSALPSVPDGHAVIGDRIAFRDRRNAVMFDPRGDLAPLAPAKVCQQ
jgi:hypothetical protein